MANWSSLSAKVQQEVVGRMDFRSRFRFRHVSKSSQELVDATPLYIPRVVFNAKSTTDVILSIYLGIDKWIDVMYKKDRNSKGCIVKVKSFTCGKVQILVPERHVDSPTPVMLALAAFKHVTMNQETLCEGIELLSTKFINFPTLEEADAFFGRRCYRTKVLSYNEKASPCLVVHVDPDVLQEIRIFGNNHVTEFGFGDVHTYTKRVHVRLEDYTKWTSKRDFPFSMAQSYVPTKQDYVADILRSRNFAEIPRKAIVTKYKRNDFSVDNYQECDKNETNYVRVTKCGNMYREAEFEFAEAPEPTECEMRWACPTHGDPFEHWYMMKTSRGFYKNHRPLLPPVKGVKSYMEYMCPVTNKVCPVTFMLFWFCEQYDASLVTMNENEFMAKVARLLKKKRNKA